MPVDPAKAFEHLYGALSEYQTLLIETNVKACGFFLLVLGWLLTSEKARQFVEESIFTKTIAIFGAVMPAIATVLLSLRIRQIMEGLRGQLDALNYFPPPYYEFRLMPARSAAALMVVAIAPCIVLIIFVLPKKKKQLPAQE
jgi:hypothetical protein